jgi:hypothetical protein
VYKLLKGMNAAERLALGLDTFANEKLLPLDPIHATTLQTEDTVLIPTKIVFGEAFAGTKLSSVLVLKRKPDGTTVMLNWQRNLADISDGQFAWTDVEGAPIPEEQVIVEGSVMYLNVAIKDNGPFDWDNETDQSVIDPVTLANGSNSSENGRNNDGSGGDGYESGGGCDAGLGIAGIGALALLGAALLQRRRGRGTK